MNKKLVALFFLGFFGWGVCEGQVTFQETIGGIRQEIGYCIQQTADGGYIIAGQTQSYGAGNTDVYFIKISPSGNILWTKTFGGASYDIARSIHQTSDGGFVITGYTMSYGAGSQDVFLIRTDANGNTLWTKTYGGADYDVGFSVQQTTDGGYIIAGQTHSFGAGEEDVYLLKTDSNGNLLWSRTFGGIYNDYAQSVEQTNDGGYILCGRTYSFGGWDGFLIKTDYDGDSLWTKTYGGVDFDAGYSASQTTDGGYILIGYTVSFGVGYQDVYLIKTDTTGNVIWSKAYGLPFYDAGISGRQTTDGGYIIAGWTESFAGDDPDIYLLKTDSVGGLIWSETLGGINRDASWCVQQTSDGGYVMVGYSDSFGIDSNEVYVIKTDSLGNSGCNQIENGTLSTKAFTQVLSPLMTVTSPSTIVYAAAMIVGSGGINNTHCTTVGIQSAITNPQTELSIYPNPFTHTLTIQSHSAGKKEIILFDVTGKEILRQQSAEAEIKLNTEEIAEGFYLLKVEEENFKVIKE
jgi:hypothetical protein